MDWVPFHHPDISLPVVGRRLGEELLDLFFELGEIRSAIYSASRGNPVFTPPKNYDQAVDRLRKKGFIVRKDGGVSGPLLMATAKGKARRSEALRPERFWNRRWNGIWYVLVYDVPESNRTYRASLRIFLRRLRMGCLQGSVWVSPTDIRPDYDDLEKAAGLGGYAFLFESRTVLGRSAMDLVFQAWNFDRIGTIQALYRDVFEENLRRLREKKPTKRELFEIARRELDAYLSAMKHDPLLPRELWPRDYLGEDNFQIHQEFTKTIRRYL